MFGPIGRMLIVLMLIAAAWVLWWVWPARPLRRVQISGTSVPSEFRLVPESDVAFVSVGQFRLGPMVTGWKLVRLSDGEILASGPCVSTWGISPKGDYVICDELDQFVKIEAATGRELMRSTSMSLPRSSAIRFSGDVSRFAIKDQGVKVFETSSLKLVAHLPEVQGDFDLSFVGRFLAATELAPKLFTFWNVDTQERIDSLVDESVANVRVVRISPRGDYAAILVVPQSQVKAEPDSRGLVIVFDLKSFKRVGEFFCVDNVDSTLQFSADGHLLYIGKLFVPAQFVDLDASPPKILTDEFMKNMARSAVTPDSGFHLAINYSNQWRLYSFRDNKLLAEGKVPRDRISNFGLAPDGQWWWSIQWPVELSQSQLRSWIERLIGQRISKSGGAVFRHVSTGRTIHFGDVFPVAWESSGNKVWTQRNCDSTPGNGMDTILEQWSLDENHSIWWMWILTATGLAVIIVDFKRQASSKRKSPVAA